MNERKAPEVGQGSPALGKSRQPHGLGAFNLSELAAQAEQLPAGTDKQALLSALQIAFEDVRSICAEL